MKNLRAGAVLLILIFSTFSTEAALEEYKLTGRLISIEEGKFDDIVVEAVKVLPTGQRSELVKVNEDGEFEVTGQSFMELNQIWFTVGDIFSGELLLSKDLHIELDLERLSQSNRCNSDCQGVILSGTDAEATLFSNKWTNFQNKKRGELIGRMISIFQKEYSLQAKLDTLNAHYLAVQDLKSEFLRHNPSEFEWVISNSLNSFYYSQHFMILVINQNYGNWETLQKGFAHLPRILGNGGLTFHRYLSYLLKEIIIEGPQAENFNNLEKNLSRLERRQRDYVFLAALPEEYQEQEKYVNRFIPYVNEWVKQFAQNLLAESKIKTEAISSKIEQSKASTLVTALGKPHKEFEFGAMTFISKESDPLVFIETIVNQFRDKAVIIDLWATWCGPCIDDMKNSKAVKKKVETLPLEIVYVCTEDDGSIESWEKRIVQTESTGNHIFITQELTLNLMEYFEKSGFPSYLFFDRNGKYHNGVVTGISSLNLEKIKVYY